MASGCVRDVSYSYWWSIGGRKRSNKAIDHHHNAISLKGLHHSGGRVVEIFLKTKFSVCQSVRYPTRWE